MVPKRLCRLEQLTRPDCPRVFVARSVRARLLGLAFLGELPRDCGLLLPRCQSVHTFGMRFALDLLFIGEDGHPLQVRSCVPPRRIARLKGAWGVLERQAWP